jgi:hypothetical protein
VKDERKTLKSVRFAWRPNNLWLGVHWHRDEHTLSISVGVVPCLPLVLFWSRPTLVEQLFLTWTTKMK